MAIAVPSQSSEAALLIDVGDQQHRHVITKSPWTIGRAEECDATIPDLKVSRQQARVLLEGDEYFIVDSQSRHGTFVNGSRCERARLKNKDEITFGAAGVKIVFLQGSTVATPAHTSTNQLLTRLVSRSDSSDLEKLRLFLEAARSLTGGVVMNDVLRNMLDYALKITKAERGFVYLKDNDKNGAPVLACGIDNTGASLMNDARVSHSVVQEALASAAEFITGDALQQQALAERQSIVINELRTVIAIPLRARHGTAVAGVDGVLYLDSRSVSHNLSGVSHEVLRALASECAAVLESAKLVAAEQAAQQYRKEMEIAASIQRSLISAPVVENDFARVNACSIPCREVGGDFFDVHVAPDVVTVIVADVSGKGISAALLASVIHGMFYAQMTSGSKLVDAVASVNRFLCSRVAGQKYATLLAAQLHRNGRLAIVNCGHVPAIVAQDSAVAHVDDGDMPVGLIAEAGFHVIERELPAGARLCMLTDGISETENAEGAEFGTHVVADCLHGAEPIREILAAVESFSAGAEAQDDRTLVVLQRIK
ncbi:MAG TPA: SpoIIE family protein phosphatase [Candidatus Angelobacter sp.]